MSKSLIILAGGKSKRMKMNKEYLKVADEFLVIKSINNLALYFDDIIVVSNNDSLYQNLNVTVKKDIFKDVGPLAGIHIGLQSIKNKEAYIIACDMPFFDFDYINFLYDNLNDNDIIISNLDGFNEPFQGIYSKKIIDKIEFLIKQRKYAISNLYELFKTKIINYNTTKFNKKIFLNLNTKEQFKTYLDLGELDDSKTKDYKNR